MYRRVYVPEFRLDRGNPHACLLQFKHYHHHPTAGHFGYKKTLEPLRRDYVWLSIRSDGKNFVAQIPMPPSLRLRCERRQSSQVPS